MPRKFALPIAILAWLFFAWFMWATLIGVNMGSICGKVLAPWAYLAERIVFLPTLWLTRPLDQWLEMHNFGMAITIGSIIETALLATIYSSILYLLLRRTLIQSLQRFFRRFAWPLAAVVVLMIGSSIWLRAQLEAHDYGRPLEHEASKTVLTMRNPLVADKKIGVTAKHTIPSADLPSPNIIARAGAAPLVIDSERDHYQFRRLLGDHMEPLPDLALSANAMALGEPRCANGRASEVLVAVSAGEGGGTFVTTPLSTPSLAPAPARLDSAQVLVAPEGTYYIGIGDQNALKVMRGSKELMSVPRFSDHTLNNVAATRTSDGILHILGTEVLIPNENSSRVHYFKVDSQSGRQLRHDVLMVRAKFTSTSTPRIAHIGDHVDAFWHNDGGGNPQPEDGVYARRIGEATTWHLIGQRSEFAVLEDADGRGSMLVGCATNPSESGVVHWFLRRDDLWYDVGQTDAGETLYTMNNSGTDPFAVWRGDAPGTVHVAFNANEHLVVQDLQLP